MISRAVARGQGRSLLWKRARYSCARSTWSITVGTTTTTLGGRGHEFVSRGQIVEVVYEPVAAPAPLEGKG